MIDFIRIYYYDKRRLERFILKDKRFVEVLRIEEERTSQIRYPYRTKICNMDVSITENHATIKNSIHKLKNIRKGYGNQNHNDFSYSQLVKTIDYLCSRLIDLDKTKITQLEIGLNIETPLKAIKIISTNVLMHDYSGPNMDEKYGGSGKFILFKHDEYYIKIYDKAKQFRLKHKNILRFEIKFIRRSLINDHGIVYLKDLKSKENLKKLFDYLLRRFDEMIIVDKTPKDISSEDNIQLSLFKSSEYWTKYKDRSLRNKKSEDIIKFQQILKKYDLLKMKNNLRQLLVEKFNYLINN